MVIGLGGRRDNSAVFVSELAAAALVAAAAAGLPPLGIDIGLGTSADEVCWGMEVAVARCR